MKDDGGPAFPCDGPTRVPIEQCGMTKRDMFALGALIALGAQQSMNDEFNKNGAEVTINQLGIASYAIADAMLAARKEAGW